MRYLIMCAFFCFLSGCDPEEDAFIQKRRLMVENQIKARGIKDEKVLKAMLETRRDLFVPKGLSELAYQDNAFPIGDGQTISQPYIVALMTELAKVGPQSKVLEIGTGSGYQSAILS
ncbi:MAG TPA: protein-L-isoaspartate O-methyltransferase, partial [Candidatus Omnitrophota bacterium]|nr:protein-L-isoaspartate O-methyltransferase [Candidatus Omnitrophota bacterium]